MSIRAQPEFFIGGGVWGLRPCVIYDICTTVLYINHVIHAMNITMLATAFIYIKVKGKVHPRTGHEEPRGGVEV
jgi:hypothetical protein